MPAQISYGARDFTSLEGESVLDCLARNGIAVPHGCRSGVCQSCLMQGEQGTIPAAAQKELKPAFIKQDLFLSCQCIPEGDMRVSMPQAGRFDARAAIAGKEMLNASVMRVRLAPVVPFACEPGQYITLITSAGVARSYSIANEPAGEGVIELHVRLLPGGAMSGFLRAAAIGEELVVRGPAGSCTYAREEGPSYPIVLAGTGTGLAPLYGILRKAIDCGHLGPIQLFHGALSVEDLYLVGELQELQRNHGNFRYIPCVLNGDLGKFYTPGHVEGIVLAALPPQKLTTRLFLCGAPEFVTSLRRKAFLAGLASKHIAADAFLPARPLPAAA